MIADVKQTIRQWCEQERLFQEEIPDDTVAFRYRVIAPATAGRRPGEPNIDILDIVKAKEDGDRIVVTSGIEFDETLSSSMKSFQGAEEIMLNLEMILDSRNELYFVDYSDGILKSITVFEEIFEDGLTKDRLMRAIRGVNKTLVVALWEIRPLIEALGADVDKILGLESVEKLSEGTRRADANVV
jgi:hypothetical protein